MSKARLLLADDHQMVAETFKKLLEPELEVIGVASDGRKLIDLAQQTRPDVVLLDLGMPSLNGFDACSALNKSFSRHFKFCNDIIRPEDVVGVFRRIYCWAKSLSQLATERHNTSVHFRFNANLHGLLTCIMIAKKKRNAVRSDVGRPKAPHQGTG